MFPFSLLSSMRWSTPNSATAAPFPSFSYFVASKLKICATNRQTKFATAFSSIPSHSRHHLLVSGPSCRDPEPRSPIPGLRHVEVLCPVNSS